MSLTLEILPVLTQLKRYSHTIWQVASAKSQQALLATSSCNNERDGGGLMTKTKTDEDDYDATIVALHPPNFYRVQPQRNPLFVKMMTMLMTNEINIAITIK